MLPRTASLDELVGPVGRWIARVEGVVKAVADAAVDRPVALTVYACAYGCVRALGSYIER